jgi:7,8-dihydropterin-6-yl-methyl-4-(beta-D-ribofuranosyl)aminobenzene 5'-phosphate synthase
VKHPGLKADKEIMAKKVEITTVVDNYIDIFIPSTAAASYPVPGRASQLWAEQGLSLWIEVSDNDRTMRILYDFGRSEQVLLRNVELLGLDFRTLDYLVLSHGHLDHYGCLFHVLENTSDGCKLIVHPGSYGRKRFFRQTDGTYVGPWEIDARVFNQFGSRLEPKDTPSDLGVGVHVSGEIEKKTEFEPGMPNAFVEVNGELVHDEIPDDQSIFIELEGKGIVVLTGCCHAGVVNTLAYARKLFPEQPIYALIGGLHLNSASGEQMQNTIEYLSQSEIRYISGLHCTGYYAQRILMEKFRDCWLPNTVGTKLTFTGR